MALQTSNLAMVGLGVLGDHPPNELQPPLLDGVHLRWAFKQELGFPWHGFYLFRRLHREADPLCIRGAISDLQSGPWSNSSLSIPDHGQFTSDENLLLTDDFPPTGAVEFDLAGRTHLLFQLTPDKAAHRLEVHIGFREAGRIELIALADDVPIDQVLVTGSAGHVETVVLEADYLTGIEFGPGPAVLIDVCFLPVLRDATAGWEPVPDFPYPLCLPVTHPDYPCTAGLPENLESARELAANRVRYGDPGQFTSSPGPLEEAGTVSLVSGSPIVVGSGTIWSDELIGAAFRVVGDTTAYTVLMVIAPNKLLLSRGYVESSAPGRAYTITQEPFGQLHDYLVHLVQGGAASTPMEKRQLPAPVHGAGVVSVALGSAVVTGMATNWDANLAGLALQVDGDEEMYVIAGVDSPTKLTLDRNYTGVGGNSKAYSIVGTLQSMAVGKAAPRMLSQSPLGLILLGSLHPALAQILGLYWVDESVEPGIAHDYVIVADDEGRFQGLDPQEAAQLLREIGFSDVDGFIVFNKMMAPAASLQPPEELRVYSLPGSSMPARDGALLDASNNAGLRWELELAQQGTLRPGAPVMYHVWRATLGEEEPTETPSPDQFELITNDQPILVTRPRLPAGAQPERSPNWPPEPLHASDRGLSDGWYSYNVSSIDIFGRHSPNSKAAKWYQWQPVPDPRPWYYEDPPGDREVHPFAVRLLDKLAPPPPTAIEAFALDPDDPLVLKDAAYNVWRETLSPEERETVIGLRVRWLWTEAHMRQAPDTREFRIYYHSDPLNALLGRTTGVSPVSATESEVNTDIPNVRPADAYAGGWLRTGSGGFAILASAVGSPLRLRVRNIGAEDDSGPHGNEPCTVRIPSDYSAGRIAVVHGSDTVKGAGTGWLEELTGRILKIAGESAGYTIKSVDTTEHLTLDRGYEGKTGSAKPYLIRHPLFTDYSIPTSWQERLYVVPFDDEAHVTVTTDSAGRPLRKYELFLPAPDDTNRSGLPLVTSVAEPSVYAHIGVSAADDKTHSSDDPKWDAGAFGGRFGNEGHVGSPAKVFQVRRERPEPPAPPPPDSDKVFATPADYHDHSYYTYRWRSAAHLKVHIFRSLDDAVFKADWARRPRVPLGPNDLEFFPSQAEEPSWNFAKRQQVAAELNALNDFAANEEGTLQAMALYRTLSNDGLRVLAGLAGNERAFTQLTIQPLDPDEPATANRPGPDNPSDFLVDPNLRIHIDALDGRSTNRYFYRAAYVDSAHNRSALSLSGSPIYLPNVIPPRAPVITKVLGGDRQLTVRWVSNREPDLKEYRIYRAVSRGATRDLRLMSLVHTELVPPGDPVARPKEVEWVDESVPTLISLYYIIVAVDEAGNSSIPSNSVTVQAYDDARPAPPIWGSVTAVAEGLELHWTLADPSHRPLVQRRDPLVYPPRWENLSSWLPAATGQIVDTTREDRETYFYRIRVQDGDGKTNRDFTEMEV